MESHTPRPVFTQEKAELEQAVLDMVSRADALLLKAVDSLAGMDMQMAYDAMMADDEIDELEDNIEQRCIRMLALQQPIGSDLREVGTILKIITDIERIGDLGVDVAKTTLKIDGEMGNTDYIDIKPMMEVARVMIREAIQAFVKRDVTGLPKVGDLENQVDEYYRDLRSQVHQYMRENPDQVVAASWMVLAIHCIERVADHALNIAERVTFMVTGERKHYHGQEEEDAKANANVVGPSTSPSEVSGD